MNSITPKDLAIKAENKANKIEYDQSHKPTIIDYPSPEFDSREEYEEFIKECQDLLKRQLARNEANTK